MIRGYLRILRQQTWRRIRPPLEKRQYLDALKHGRPYFGIFMRAAQAGVSRGPIMKKLVDMETSKADGAHYSVLEVGSWAGSSAVLWAQSIKQFNGRHGIVICIDPWEPYVGPDYIGEWPTPAQMERILREGKIYNLFLHNIAASGHADMIKPYKGLSDDLLPSLRDNWFHLVYIDGKHSYTQVLKDLQNCERLVWGGVLAGIGLELQKHQIDVKYAEENKERDYIRDIRTSEPFHPGVTLAVHEFFGGPVSSLGGVWAMRKTETGWQEVYFPEP